MRTLNKTKGKDFIILNLSDPQLGNGEWEQDHPNRKILTETVKTLVNRTHPDLITVSGDLAWAGDDAAYDALAEFFEGFSIPWTLVWGNHDNQKGPEAVERVVSRYEKLPHFLYERGPENLGNGNFVLRIEEEGRVVEGLILMDTHDRAPYTAADGQESSEWAKLIPEQLDWYEEQIRSLEIDGCHDTTLITHIPIYAYREASAAAFRADADPGRITPEESETDAPWNPGYERSFGVQYEGICSYPADEGAFDRIRRLGSTKHVLAGHDHVNNTVIPYGGVTFIYSLKAGAGCYWNPKLNGGTVLRVTENGVEEVRHEYVDPTPWLAEKTSG